MINCNEDVTFPITVFMKSSSTSVSQLNDTLLGEISKIDDKFHVLAMSSFRLCSAGEVKARYVVRFTTASSGRIKRRMEKCLRQIPAQESRVLSPDDD